MCVFINSRFHSVHAGEGREVELLVEGPSTLSDKVINVSDDPNCIQMSGRTRGDHITVFQGQRSLGGQYVTARVTRASAFTLFAELVE